MTWSYSPKDMINFYIFFYNKLLIFIILERN